ncbi:hypothetical protein BVRB_032150, partial [Beta vulgaris subsp. vulgaris]|jgi:hypothetical protein
MTSI